MADTVRTIGYLTGTSFADGQAPGAIRPQNVRDLIVSSMLLNAGAQPSANYTLALTDGSNCLSSTATGAITITVPANSTVALPVGTVISILQYGAGQVTVAAAVGVTVRTASSLTTRAQYSMINLWQRAANEWIASGDLT